MLISSKDRPNGNRLGNNNGRRNGNRLGDNNDWRRLLSRNGRRTECGRCGKRFASDLRPSYDRLGR
jgi:hypothetical protein